MARTTGGAKRPVARRPLVQHMGRGRVRIDPTFLPELLCWLVTWREPLERVSRMSIRGLRGARRAKALGMRRWAASALRVVDMVATGATQTGPAREFDEALAAFLAHRPSDAGTGD